MVQLKVNFMSYTLGYPVNIDMVLPSFSSCDMDPGKERSHKVRAKYPVLYSLHGHGYRAVGIFSPAAHIGHIKEHHGIPEPIEAEELIAGLWP